MDNNVAGFVTCSICSGKGGWKKEVNHRLDDNWVDCGYCEGYGFHDSIEDDYGYDFESHILMYNHYKKLITELISDNIASIDSFTTYDMGETITMQLVPYSREKFGQFVAYMLKLCGHSTNLDADISQKQLYNKSSNNYYTRWEITICASHLNDLEGFVNIIKFWDKK